MNSFVNVQVRILAAQAQRQLDQLDNRIAGLERSFGGAQRGATLFGTSLNGMRLDAFGSRVQWIGRQLEYNFTIPIIAAAAASYKFALENEAAFTRVTKVYGDAAHGAEFYAQEIDALRRNFEALSNAYGVNQKETIDIAAAWAAAGASGLALAKSVDLTLQTMILGEMKAAEATEALIAIQAQYGLSVAELTKTISILNMVENQTGISLAGLVQGFSRAAGVARSAGVDVRHLAAMLAALTPATGSAAQAGNALKTIFSRLLSPTKETTEVLSLMGINIADMAWKSSNATDRLMILSRAFEGLSDSQKGVVSSVIASRWQINKFEILMRELTNANGYYQKALRTTSDQTAVFAQMQRELNAVLSSNPRRLQIIWTMLQNAAADIIQPMIPLLLYLATVVQKVVTWFSELNPSVQKLVVTLLLLLAVVGPLVRLGGALVLLVAELTNIFTLLLVPVAALTKGFWSLVKVPVVKFLTAIGLGVRAAILSLTALGPILARVGVLLQSALISGAVLAGIAWRAGMGLLYTITVGGLEALRYLFVRSMIVIQGIMLAGATVLGRVWRTALMGIYAIQKAWAVLMAINWRAIFTVMIAVAIAGFAKLRAIFTAFIPALRAFGLAMLTAMTGPWGIAIGAVIALVLLFWDDLKKIWAAIVEGTIRAWNALPAGIKNAMMAVVNIVNAAARAVYNAFSWMNPWARHSPSLVENVTTGVAEIKKQYASLDEIADIFEQAGLSLEEFGKAVAKVKRAAELQDIAEQRQALASIAADALPAFDALVRVLQPLRNLLAEIGKEVASQQAVVDSWKMKLDAANVALEEQERILQDLQNTANAYKSELDAAQAELDRFANAPIEGMKALNDAIFANEMEQKRLRLEMMRMEDAIGPLDELEGRIQAINGQMEMLSGEQADLRNAGAGSDILSFYDEQIDALEQQHDAIVQQLAPIQNLADQIEDLGRQAEMLDLEKSLAFDPLKKQIDDLINSMEEMPFEEILAGVTENKAKVDELTAAYNQANAAVAAQQAVVDQLKASRDLIQASYDAELAKLDQLQTKYQAVEDKIRDIEQALRDVSNAAQSVGGGAGGMSPGAENFLASAGGNFPDVGGMAEIGREGGLADQSKLIDDFTKEIADKTKNMFGLFDFLEPVKKAWNTAVGWLKTNVGPAFSAIGDTVSNVFGGIKNPFEKFESWLDVLKEVGGFIKDTFGTIWEVIGPEVIELAQEAWKGLQDAFAQIQPEIEKFKDLIGPAGEALKNLWEFMKPVLMVVLGLIMLVVKAVLSAIGGAIGPFIRAIGSLISGVIQTLRGIIEFIIGVFTGDWEMAWQGIKDIFEGIWNGTWGVLKNLGLAIWGFVKGLVEGIVDFFVWLWDELVGHSIIPDMVNGILDWFQILLKGAKYIFDVLVNAIRWAWENIVRPVFTAWGNAINVLKNVFSTVFNWLKSAWDGLVLLFKVAVDKVRGHIEFLKSGWEAMKASFSGVVNNVKTWIDKLVGWFNELKKRFNFSGLFDGLKDAFKSAVNWIIGKWNNLSFGVGPFAANTPNIPYLARGGMIASQATAVVGEGRKGYPEYVIPTDPMYRDRALNLFAALGKSLGINSVLERATVFNALQSIGGRIKDGERIAFYASGGVLGGSIRRRSRGGTTYLVAEGSTNTYHFHGNLEFPNVRDGSDAEEFLKNLEALISED